MKNCILVLSLYILNLHSLNAQTFTDPRDGKLYKIKTFGELTWFAENLRYESKESYCYEEDDSMCEQYGRLYKWEEALRVCPQGWHLSTEYDWQYLEVFLGMDPMVLNYRGNRGENEGGKMKKGGESGLEVLLAGYRSKNGKYRRLNENSAFWTANEADMYHAWHRDIDMGDDFVYRSRVVKSYALSCRCVQNYLTEDSPEDK